MYNLADEGVQFSPTQLFNQTRRGCSTSNGQGVQLGRYIQLQVNGDRIVIGIGKIVVAAVHADNLTRV